MASPEQESDSSSGTPAKIAATAAAAGVVAASLLLRSVSAAAAVQTQPHHQKQNNSSSGTYGIATDNNLRYTPKLQREQEVYCTRIIDLNLESGKQSRYCGNEQYRVHDT